MGSLRLAVLLLLLLGRTTPTPTSAPRVSSPTPVFYKGLENSTCFRIPSLLETKDGTLLAFAEDRTPGCSDDSDPHRLVVRRSEDRGATWGPIIEVYKPKADEAPCDDCARACSNPNPVQLPTTGRVLVHFDTFNNPTPDTHGADVSVWSDDDGKTWSSPPEVLAYPPLENQGGLIGPSVGVVDASNRTIFFSTRFDGDTHLYWSTDDGATWQASETALEKVDECSLAALPAPGRILANCRTSQNQRAQVIWDNGVPGDLSFRPDLPDPGCQGSVVSVLESRQFGPDAAMFLRPPPPPKKKKKQQQPRYTSVSRGHRDNDDDDDDPQSSLLLFLSNNNSTETREHLTVKRSEDGGETYDDGILVWPNASGYSQLAPLLAKPPSSSSAANDDDALTLGLLFECGPDGKYHDTISFVTVTYPAGNNDEDGVVLAEA